jgi:hypothetical protein
MSILEHRTDMEKELDALSNTISDISKVLGGGE